MTKEQKVIKTLVEEVNSQNPTLLKEHNISINYEITDQRSCLLIADIFKMALKEIFLNTSRNAFPDSTLTVSSKNNDTSFTLSFTNQGPVIEADRLEGLGKPFELGEEHHDKHTGLGLAVVNTIMEMHNGSMQIENDGDRGVITRLIFPTA
jgi:K+-sensing histidine kinase KdpD